MLINILNISVKFMIIGDIVVCPAEGRERTHHSAGSSSFCQAHA